MTLTSSAATVTAEEMFADNGMQVVATYKGIPGTAFCQGSDCKVEAAGVGDDRKFTGSWYFTPMSRMVYYEVGEATTYTPETNYAQFGHWLW